METLQIFNTLNSKKEVFNPIDKNHIKIYACGPTVYNFAHIGNARMAVVFDTFVRTLRVIYPKVTYVSNITDMERMFRNTTVFMDQDNISYNNPIIYSENPLLSGYISKENLEVIKSTVPFKTGAYKKGQVTCFTDNTNFRAFWYGTNKLLMNAIYFSDQF